MLGRESHRRTHCDPSHRIWNINDLWSSVRKYSIEFGLYMGSKVHMQRFCRPTQSAGFGLLELMIVLVIASLLLTLAIPAYDGYVQRARTAKAIGDIANLSLEIEKFRLTRDSLPPLSLNELPVNIPVDPWQRPYQYLSIAAAGPGVGALRKDGKLNPLNTDFDLYSIGKDGKSAGPLNAKASRDDIVRANDGAFIGRAEDY
jgi:general secretion pathway protein G